ncbi:MAG: HAD family hydrolase [Methanoregula sp.]|jgi:D-glycero-D-manno-heptose 1,7-bisphosphate phosphatase|uniref:D-glycero-alpha-D-manno-heptose-1,7-bisphosphate 7-phosphatase n=1 Tax=Methanoregula sp. TaxID=2052170 RepID=UPI003C195CE5
MKPAVFLDRDGVINKLVLNMVIREYEPPHSVEDLVLFPDAIQSLRDLQDAGFALFLVSNQPDYAKGKTTLEQIRAVHERFDHLLKSEGILFRDYYYCYHHPNGIVPEYSFACECRKPKPYFLLKAARDYGIDLTVSWMVGDRDTDIACGKAAGTRTILILEPHSAGSRGSECPDYRAENLMDAVRIILRNPDKQQRV